MSATPRCNEKEEKCTLLVDVAALNNNSTVTGDNILLSPEEVQSKITDFSNLFNSSYRLSLLNCQQAEKHQLMYLLISLKKNIKCAIKEVGKSLRNRHYHFSCGLCDEPIVIEPNEDIWLTLQNHEHFEQLYYQLLNNTLQISPISEKLSSMPITVREDTIIPGDSNTDSGIEQQEIESSGQQSSSSKDNDNSSDENVNNFRFNFNNSYDEDIENKLYPSSLMQGIRKYDKKKEYSIMRVSSSRAACLICHCDLNGKRISKLMLVNHAMGQKHLKASIEPDTQALLEFFHDFWLRQDRSIQAHQVYFRPRPLPTMKCVLCTFVANCGEIVTHIYSDLHKKKVLELFEKRAILYYLVNVQVLAYGITQEQIDVIEKENQKLKEEAKIKEKRPKKNNSDSDTADELNKSQSGEHNIVKSVENPESANTLNRLPNRMKKDRAFFKRITKLDGATTCIHCDLCKCDVNNSEIQLKEHILKSTLHIQLNKDKYTYYCEICDMKYPDENAWMTHDFAGPRHLNMAASRKNRVTEYECTGCKMVIFGDELSLNRHLALGNKRGNRREQGNKLPDPVQKLFNSKNGILAQAALLAGDAQDVLDNSLTQNCCDRLQLALNEVFEECNVYPFGSRISGIGNKDSDLDVFVDIGDTYFGNKNQDPTDQVLVIRKANKAFIKNKEYSNIFQVLTARTPILKLHHEPTSLDCDLSFKHGLSVENTKFLRFCLELQPVCQQLILLVKKWAEHIYFESITTYALAIMCIFYLQVNGHLPSVEKLRELNKKPPQSINGWKTIHYILSVTETKAHIKPYKQTVLELIQDFFKYYWKFDFNSYVICPLLGRVVKRSLFSEGNPNDLPVEMNAYVAQLDGDSPEVFRSNSYLCVQDPFDLSHNLTKAVQQGTLTKFVNMCKLTLARIQALK